MPIRTVVRDIVAFQEQVAEYVCNACGKSHVFSDKSPDAEGFHTILLSGGYGDRFPGDMDTLNMVVCEDCLEAWVKTFKYPDVFEPQPIVATHSETGEVFHFTEYLAHPENMPEAEVQTLLTRAYEVYDEDDADAWKDHEEFYGGIWEHYKGNRYLLKEAFIHFTPDLVPHVLYRELYGDSRYWLRPLNMWLEFVRWGDYKGPRFKRVAADHGGNDVMDPNLHG